MSEPAAAAFIRGRTVMPFRNSQVDASARRALAGISEQRRLAVLAGKLWNSGLEPLQGIKKTGVPSGIKNQKTFKNQEYTEILSVNKSALLGTGHLIVCMALILNGNSNRLGRQDFGRAAASMNLP